MLHGRICRLRPFQADDLPAMRRWFGDPDTMRFWARPAIVSPAAFADDIAGRFARFDDSGYFAILDASGDLVGRIEYEGFLPVDRVAELMILIGEPAARGRGIGADAMLTLLRHLFLDRDAHRAWLTVIATNAPAIALYRKLGFQDEGVARRQVRVDGVLADQLVMGMLQREFLARWADFP
jgi:RimJ/RimL family protein N-acetyltransferase